MSDTTPTAGAAVNSFDVLSPTLYIVFRDDAVATLTQEKLVLAMAALHMAAPSEYQVLSMLIHLLQSSAVGKSFLTSQFMIQYIFELLHCVRFYSPQMDGRSILLLWNI